MTVLNKVVQTWDGANRRIYLKQGITEFYPIEDLYHEYRNERRLNESFRKFDPLIRAEGNVPKGAGAFTPRYAVLLDGTKIVPFNEAIQLNQLGDIITDNPDVDPTLYDVSGLTVAKPIFIKPSEAETIQLNSESIVFSSFQGAVWVDVTSPYSDKGSSAQPNGNTERPVNTVQLAVEIAIERGFNTLKFLGNLTIGAGDDVSNFTIQGTNPMTSVLIMEPVATAVNAYIRDCYFSGTLDGDCVIRDCVIGNVYYFSGYIEHCALTSQTVYVNGMGVFMNCSAGATCISPPVIDLTNASGVAVRNFDGTLRTVNKTSTGTCEINLTGELIIDSTVSNGVFKVHGDGYVTDNSTGTFVLDDRTTGTPAEIAAAVWAHQDAIDMASDIDFLKAIEGGRWIIDEVLNEMVFYAEDNTTEIARFELKDASGNPTSTQPYERVRV